MNINHFEISSQSIDLLELGPGGNLQVRESKSDEDSTLHNTLFRSFYLEGFVARLRLGPGHALRVNILNEIFAGVRWDGIDYLPVGSRKSLERQEVYFVDEVTHDAIAGRFQGCMEALISQFDVLVT